MTATALERRPVGPPPRFHGVDLQYGDIATCAHHFHGPVTLTVRVWGVTSDGHPWVAGNRRSALVTDILIVERAGRRL